MGTIQAIQTEYRGYKFRSRLEARWATAFNAIGIEYEYEPEGFVIQHGNKKWPWLPDFYLPESKTWVEVKGDWRSVTSGYLEMLCRAVDVASAELSRSNTLLPHIAIEDRDRREGNGLLLLGNIPDDSDHTPVFPILKASETGVDLEFIEFWYFGPTQAPDNGFFDLHEIASIKKTSINEAQMRKHLSRQVFNPNRSINRMRDYFTKARKQRFEHGEQFR